MRALRKYIVRHVRNFCYISSVITCYADILGNTAIRNIDITVHGSITNISFCKHNATGRSHTYMMFELSMVYYRGDLCIHYGPFEKTSSKIYDIYITS